MLATEEYNPQTTFRARVMENERITPIGVREVRHLLLQTDSEIALNANDLVGVVVKGPLDYGNREHFRLYTVAGVPSYPEPGVEQFELCVQRSSRIDEFSGVEYPGAASNYLCNLKPGDQVAFSGPHAGPFQIPGEPDADLILIGMGTGIAPFRALIQKLLKDPGKWHGKIRLFFGARTGLELLYMNDQRDDFTRLIDERTDDDTFRAFRAVSPQPHLGEPVALAESIRDRASQVSHLLHKAHTRVYVAGLEGIRDGLDQVLSDMLGSEESWQRRKAELVAAGRWVELVY